MTDTLIPFTGLTFADGGEARITLEAAPDAEVVGALLMRVIRQFAASAVDEGQGVETVSVTVDITGDLQPGAEIIFTPAIDRKTRTIIFAGGAAKQNAATVLTATAIYRIV